MKKYPNHHDPWRAFSPVGERKKKQKEKKRKRKKKKKKKKTEEIFTPSKNGWTGL